MALELTPREAGLYLADLAEVLTHLSCAVEAVARLAAHTPAGAPPNAMCEALVASWESLDSRFIEVYSQLYGNEPQECPPPDNAPPAASMGPTEGDVFPDSDLG